MEFCEVKQQLAPLSKKLSDIEGKPGGSSEFDGINHRMYWLHICRFLTYLILDNKMN